MYAKRFLASFFQSLGLVILGLSLATAGATAMADWISPPGGPTKQCKDDNTCNDGCTLSVGGCKGKCKTSLNVCEDCVCKNKSGECKCSL